MAPCRAATEEGDAPKTILKKRKKMLAQINEEEKSRDRPGQATVSVRNEHTMAGRLETPTLNDITVRNAVCRELELTPLGSVNDGTEKKECFGQGPLSNKIMDAIIDYTCMAGIWSHRRSPVEKKENLETRQPGLFFTSSAR